MKQRKWLRLLAVLFGVILIAGACGGRDDDDDGGTGAGDDTEDEVKELTNGPGFDGTTIKVGVLTPLSGPQTIGLTALEQDWFAPARAALARGALGQLTLVANDRVFDIGARAGWKFWRRRVPWGERLRHDGRTTEA